MSGGEYAALAYGVVFVVVVAYVAIIAAKLQRLERDVADLVVLAKRSSAGDAARSAPYAASVPAAASTSEEEAT